MKKQFNTLYIFLLLIIFAGNLHAQYENIEVFLQGMKITDIKNDGVDIWIATEGNGIFYFKKSINKWLNFSSENNKIKQDFFYCIEIGPRFIWAGSADGLYIYDKRRDKWNKKSFSLGGQFGNWIRSVKFDKKENKLWIGRFKYLTQYDLISKKYKDFDLTVKKNDKTNSVKTISLDGDSIIWIGVEAGVHKYIKSDTAFTTKFYDSKNNFFLGEGDQVSINDILFEQNNIWFATDEFITPKNPDFNRGGLFRFDRKIDWIKLDENSKLNGNGFFSLAMSGNYIWTSSYKFDPKTKEIEGRGVSIINRKTLETKKIENNLIPDVIYSLHFDGENIWLGTNDGLRKISLTNPILPNFS